MRTHTKKVSFLSVAEPRFSFSPQTKALQEEAWKKVCAKRTGLYSAGLLRVVRVRNDNAECVFYVAKDIEYSDVVGLRNIENFREVVPNTDCFQSLSAIAVVETSDSNTVLLERDSGDWDYSLELSGGFVRAEERDDDLYQFIQRRVVQDLAIPEGAVASIAFIQPIDLKHIAEVMAVFRVQLNISFRELLEASTAKVFCIPKGYVIDRHSDFFTIPLHHPSGLVLRAVKSL